MEGNQGDKWIVKGTSVQGTEHVRRGLPNQDAIDWWPTEGAASRVILTVCDGHGSEKSFRSDRGSRLATVAGLAIAQDLIAFESEGSSAGGRHRVQDELGRMLLRRWLGLVDAELEEKPITLQELEALAASPNGQTKRHEVEENPRLAYGSTSLGVIITETTLVYWQIGDGDIMAVRSGEAWRPIAHDESLFANDTRSLCLPEAWRDVRVELSPARDAPDLIVLATDGLSNSFVDDAGLLKFSSDLASRIVLQGLPAVAERLTRWLDEISQAGSGDDVTVGVVSKAIAGTHTKARELTAATDRAAPERAVPNQG